MSHGIPSLYQGLSGTSTGFWRLSFASRNARLISAVLSLAVVALVLAVSDQLASGVVEERDDHGVGAERADQRDYDTAHYARVLRDTYAARLARAVSVFKLDQAVAQESSLAQGEARLALR